jgi:hypothetical protein
MVLGVRTRLPRTTFFPEIGRSFWRLNLVTMVVFILPTLIDEMVWKYVGWKALDAISLVTITFRKVDMAVDVRRILPSLCTSPRV